jgi:hypothetical protein
MTRDWTISHRLNLKLEWAYQHITDLQEVREDWRGKNEDRVSFEDDPNTGDRTYWAKDVPPIPDDFSLLAGDAIHNIRSVLDHLAYHMMTISPGISSDHLQYVYFPIAETPQKYKSEAVKRIEGMRQDAKDAIDKIQPYEGGAGKILWRLHSLDIIDKHKVLIAGASTNPYHSMSPSKVKTIKDGFLGMRGMSHWDTYTPADNARLFQVETAHRHLPLKTGDKILTIPNAEVNEDMYFSLEIAFREPKVVAGQSIIQTLMQMYQFVSSIVMNFDRQGFLE